MVCVSAFPECPCLCLKEGQKRELVLFNKKFTPIHAAQLGCLIDATPTDALFSTGTKIYARRFRNGTVNFAHRAGTET